MKPCPPLADRPRRGSNTIEFALLLPVFVAVIAFAFEYSFYFYMRASAMNAVRTGCRVGAVIPPESAHSPSSTAEDAIKDNMSSSGFFNIDCTALDDDRCEISVSEDGDIPTQTLTCSMSMAYPSLTGLIPVPSAVEARSVQLLEIQ